MSIGPRRASMALEREGNPTKEMGQRGYEKFSRKSITKLVCECDEARARDIIRSR